MLFQVQILVAKAKGMPRTAAMAWAIGVNKVTSARSSRSETVATAGMTTVGLLTDIEGLVKTLGVSKVVNAVNRGLDLLARHESKGGDSLATLVAAAMPHMTPEQAMGYFKAQAQSTDEAKAFLRGIIDAAGTDIDAEDDAAE